MTAEEGSFCGVASLSMTPPFGLVITSDGILDELLAKLEDGKSWP